MDCHILNGAYELYLLGSLTAEDAAHIEDHLGRGCACCQAQLREAALTLYFLCRTTPPVRPSPKTKTALMRHLKEKLHR